MDPNATPEPEDTATLNLKATDVKYVLAKQDINIRNGPGTDFEIVGSVFAGNTAEVTGYKSSDDLWGAWSAPWNDVTDRWVSPCGVDRADDRAELWSNRHSHPRSRNDPCHHHPDGSGNKWRSGRSGNVHTSVGNRIGK